MRDDHTPPSPAPHDPADADRPVHQRAWALIPWVVNCSASPAEQSLVAAHVADCEDCRDELAFQRQLHAQMTTGRVPATDTEAALERLTTLMKGGLYGGMHGGIHGDMPGDMPGGLDTQTQAAAPPPDAAPHLPRWTRVLVAAVVVQAVGLAALLGMISERPRSADYQTLTRAEPGSASAVVRLVATPGMTLGELQAMLARSGVVIVDSLADGAAFGLALRPGTTRDAALAALRQSPGVLLAEPIAAPTSAAPKP